jgi:rubrerythrin
MVIYDLAMRLKLDGEEFYRNYAQLEEDEGVRQIFKILAEDERRQYEIIEKINSFVPAYKPSEISEKAKRVILKKGLFTERHKIKKNQLDAFKQALRKQEDCLYLYRRLVEEVEYDYEKDTFEKLVDDVEDHIRIISNMKELLN